MIVTFLKLIGKYCNSKEGSLPRKALTFILRDIVKYRGKVIKKNLSLCFKNKDNDQIEHDYYSVLSKLILESVGSYNLTKNEITGKLGISPDSIKMINESDKRVVILCSHIGNWEVIIPALPLFINKKIYAAYKPISNKKTDKWLLEVRGRFGLILKPMEQIARSFYKEPQGVFIFINDQSPSIGSKGKWLPLFRTDTQWYDGVTKLSKRGDCMFLFQKVSPLKDGYIIEYENLNKETLLEEYVSKLEQNIASFPEHWLWSHNRWKNKKLVEGINL